VSQNNASNDPGVNPSRQIHPLTADGRVVVLSQVTELENAADDLLLAMECESCDVLPMSAGEADALSHKLSRITRALPRAAIAG